MPDKVKIREYKITPNVDRGFKSMTFGGRLLSGTLMITSWDVSLQFDAGQEGNYPLHNGLHQYGYINAESFLKDWRIITRKVLIEKIGFCI